MKYLLVNSLSYKISPSTSIAIPKLIGILASSGIDVEFFDINATYINKIIQPDCTRKYYEYIISTIENNDFSIESENINNTLKIIKSEYRTYNAIVKDWIDKGDFYQEVLKNKFLFHNKLLLELALKKIHTLVGALHIMTATGGVDVRDVTDDKQKLRLNIEKIFEFANSKLNYFVNEYFDEYIDELVLSDNKPDCIGISINIEEDLLLGLFFAYKLKQKTKNIHINIGGAFFDNYYSRITNLVDLFGLFFDSISIGDSSYTVVELCKYLEGKIGICDVQNLIHCEGNNIIVNPEYKKQDFCSLPFPNFNGIKKENYLLLDYILPIQTSTSCYWKKCIFCMENKSIPYQVLDVEKVVDEIEYLSKKYNTKFFYFWDNSMSPYYMEKMAKLIRKRKLEIYYTIYARFESEFSYSLLKEMKKSGCLCVYWGLDSASDRVLEFINKGTNTETIHKILKDSYKAGIANAVYLILGHPTETVEDLENDLKFIEVNKDYIDLLKVRELFLIPGAIIYEELEKYENLIYLSSEEISNYKKKIQKTNNRGNVDFYLFFSAYYLPLIKHCGRSGMRRYINLRNFMRSHRKMLKMYIDFHYEVFRFIKRIINLYK